MTIVNKLNTLLCKYVCRIISIDDLGKLSLMNIIIFGGEKLSRTTELVLGILGSLGGFAGAFFALFMGEVDKAFSNGQSEISGLGSSAFLFSVLAFIGAILVKFKPKLGGWLMIISAVAIVISISFFGIIPGLFLFAAGLMGVIRKQKSPQTT
jgi:hypothetical protein